LIYFAIVGVGYSFDWISRAFGANEIFCYSFLMNTALLFADPNLLQLERVSSNPDLITIILKTKSKQAHCPQCHFPSAHLHSRYVRRLADLPWLGVAVRLEGKSRRGVSTAATRIAHNGSSANASQPSLRLTLAERYA
jgi:hypothetical protein